MKTEAHFRGNTVALVAPVAGDVRFCAPPAPCGELEVFGLGDVIALVDGVPVEAPDHGFLLRTFVDDGERVGEGTLIVSYRIA
ncbi:MAG TPA: hypothetical protein VGB52_03085 [Actinomycetota bacterium]|jgi:hypothetical protein